MQKIDRLGWAAGVSLYTFGLRVGVRVNDPAYLDRVIERLPPGWEPACGPFVDALYSLKVGGRSSGRTRSYTLLYHGLERLARTMNLEEALVMLESHLQLKVATQAVNRVMVHAGVVAWRGRAIVVPGDCFSGKSTLVTALLRCGATYYSDEFAVLDAHGRVHPYARRLSLRRGGDELNYRCGPEEFGSQAGVGPLPVALIALAKYRPGATWRPREISAGQAVMHVFNNTLTAGKQPEAAMHVLNRTVAGARCLRGFRGEADETARLLLKELDRTASTFEEAAHPLQIAA